jgi:carbonic anhydrase/acetyltransferase-like protein (isoleucine patch superfamily)
LAANVTVGHLVMLHGCTHRRLLPDRHRFGAAQPFAVIGKGCIVGANTLIPEGKVFPDYVADRRLAGQGDPTNSVRRGCRQAASRIAPTTMSPTGRRYQSELQAL